MHYSHVQYQLLAARGLLQYIQLCGHEEEYTIQMMTSTTTPGKSYLYITHILIYMYDRWTQYAKVNLPIIIIWVSPLSVTNGPLVKHYCFDGKTNDCLKHNVLLQSNEPCHEKNRILANAK